MQYSLNTKMVNKEELNRNIMRWVLYVSDRYKDMSKLTENLDFIHSKKKLTVHIQCFYQLPTKNGTIPKSELAV